MLRTLRYFSAGCRLVLHQGRLAVLKEAQPDSPAVRALQREAEALSRLADCQKIPDLWRRGPNWLLRAFIPGRTLASLVRDGPLSALQVARWLQRLAELLRHIHALGLWHGDVSPGNVLITEDHQVYLLDWGGPHWGTPPYSDPQKSGPEQDWHGWLLLTQELVGSRPPGGVDFPRLVGREQPLRQLKRLWSAAALSESTWVGVGAPSGGGKTALLREMQWWTGHWGWGQGSTLTTPVTYNLFQSLVENSNLAWQPGGLDAAHWRQMQTTFPAFGAPGTGERSSALSPLSVASGWTELLRQQAECYPLLLLFDDIQWMDESSQQLLELLSHRPIAGLMVVLAWRSEEFIPPSGLQLHLRLNLAGLKAEEIVLWSHRDGTALEASQARQIARWTHGNPLLISECLRRPDQPRFSTRVGWLLQERVRQIPAEFLSVLKLGALMGRDFAPGPLELVCQDPQPALRWAEEQQLLLPGLRFSHDRVREALLGEFTDEEQKSWHARLAEYYQQNDAGPQRCAFHYWQANQRQRAATFSLSAARQEKERSALASAAYFYNIACTVQPDAEVILEYARVLHLLGHNQQATDWLDKGLKLKASSLYCLTQLHLKQGVVARSQGNMSQAFHHARASWQLLFLLPREQGRQLGGGVLSLLLEVCHEHMGMKLFFRTVVPRLDWLFRNYAADNVLHANASILLAVYLPQRYLRGLRFKVLTAARQDRDPLRRARTLQRLLVHKFGEGNGRQHERLMAGQIEVFLRCGVPWELSMAYFLLCFYAAVRGEFARLRDLSAKILELTRLGNDRTLVGPALFFETVATGARISWQRLEHPPVEPQSQWYTYPAMSQALYWLYDGRPDRAHAALHRPYVGTPNPVEVGFYFSWLATVTRSLADATPRRWGARRRQLNLQALQAAERCLSCGQLSQMFRFRAAREKALALIGLGRSHQAETWFQRSLREALAFGADYEAALTLQAWGKAGLALGWTQAEERHSEGCQELARLGAWWDLTGESAGLPLQEVGQAARDYLRQPDPNTREHLKRWMDEGDIEHLDRARQRNQSIRDEVASARIALERESNRWEAFLQNGPLSIARFDRQGNCLEGTASPGEGRVSRIALPNDEIAHLSLPLARSEFAAFQRLVECERRDLRRILAALVAQIKDLPPSKLQPTLLKQCRELMDWHIDWQPATPEQIWSVDNLAIERHGEIDWQALQPQVRGALLSILREALHNARKHRPGQTVQITATSTDQLEVDIMVLGDPPQPNLETAEGNSFGLQSMSFRAGMVGGTLKIEPDFSLRLRLPLHRSDPSS